MSNVRKLANRVAVNVGALVLAIVLSVAVLVQQAHAEERRIALVIGNGSYSDIGTLKNPIADARLVRGTLEKLNFEVIYRENIDKADMERAVSAFGQKLQNAGSTGVALFYYAGHGVQSGGENFLLPVDISVGREADLRLGAVRASDVLAQMEAAQSSVKIVVLDACRDNPYATKFGGGQRTRGLADIGLGSSEFFVAYAATAGSLADDGQGVNSPYAAAFARRLPTPDSEISNTFRLIRVDVSSETRQRQLPEARTTMRREFFFAGGTKRPQVDEAAVAAPPELLTMLPKVTDIVGEWCEAGRGRGLGLDIGPTTLAYLVAGQRTKYEVRRISEKPDAKIEVEWLNRGVPVTFEFGDFDSKGGLMTQLRGRQGVDGNWKEYNLRFRKCARPSK